MLRHCQSQDNKELDVNEMNDERNGHDYVVSNNTNLVNNKDLIPEEE